MRNLIRGLIVALGIFSTTHMAAAQVQPASACAVIGDVKPADAGFKTVGVRRPNIDRPVAIFAIEVTEPTDLARTDASLDDPKIIDVRDCKNNIVLYRVKAVQVGEYTASEIVLPETAKNVNLRSCSLATGKCWSAIFDGDFSHGVTLQPETDPAKAPALRGKYWDEKKS